MKVKNLIAGKGSDIVMTTVGEKVIDTAGLLKKHRIGAVLVHDPSGSENAGIVGIISERDIINGLAAHGAAALDMAVGELMTSEVTVCSPDDTVVAVMTLRKSVV